jgi:CheY-like chemotaxis protein
MSTTVQNTPPVVLVVDDDDFSQELFRGMLGQHGVDQIHTAGNGREALDVLASLPKPPEFLICDVFMPDMDGIEFIGHLATKGFGGGIILVSGLNIEMMSIAREIARANGLKILGAFEKPLTHQVLAQAMGLG